jgi:hypothetical protein
MSPSYLWEAAHLVYSAGSAAALGWMQSAVGRVLQGEGLRVVEDLREGGRAFMGQRAARLARVCGYFEKNNHRMASHEYLAAGYPIASGVSRGPVERV